MFGGVFVSAYARARVCLCSHQRGRDVMCVHSHQRGVRPESSVDVQVLDKQRHQEIQEEEELKQEAAVQWERRDPGVTDRLRGYEG